MSESPLTPAPIPGDPRSLEPGQAIRFQIMLHGVSRDAFVVRLDGDLFAYINSCRHQSRALDLGDGQFFDGEDVLVCRHHGARYEARTGLCTAGPCEGARLTALRLEARGDTLWCVDLAP